ncbi:hypothetical protein CRYUN_Cryun24cG0065000 [Craigia yunnanensis]
MHLYPPPSPSPPQTLHFGLPLQDMIRKILSDMVPDIVRTIVQEEVVDIPVVDPSVMDPPTTDPPEVDPLVVVSSIVEPLAMDHPVVHPHIMDFSTVDMEHYPDPKEVIDPASKEHFACEEHLLQYVTGERLKWGELWWTLDHVFQVVHKLSISLIFYDSVEY